MKNNLNEIQMNLSKCNLSRWLLLSINNTYYVVTMGLSTIT